MKVGTRVIVIRGINAGKIGEIVGCLGIPSVEFDYKGTTWSNLRSEEMYVIGTLGTMFTSVITSTGEPTGNLFSHRPFPKSWLQPLPDVTEETELRLAQKI